jgi:hypothetical protein
MPLTPTNDSRKAIELSKGLRWPPNLLGPGSGLGHAIKFTVLKRVGFFGGVDQSWKNVVTATSKGGVKGTATSTNKSLGKVINAAKNSRGKGMDVKTKVLGHVYLYMPQDVATTYSVSYDTIDNGLLRNAGVLATDDSGVDYLESIKRLGGAAAKQIGGSVLSKALSIATQTEEESMGKALLKSVNLAKNPHQEQIFTNVEFRSFPFTFKFNPRAESECKSVVDIIRVFKRNMLPSMQENEVQRFWNYPNEFQLEFLKGENEPNEHLFKFGKCALTSVSCNYTAAGVWAAYRNGHPVDVDLSLEFTELEVLSQEKIDQGY